ALGLDLPFDVEAAAKDEAVHPEEDAAANEVSQNGRLKAGAQGPHDDPEYRRRHLPAQEIEKKFLGLLHRLTSKCSRPNTLNEVSNLTRGCWRRQWSRGPSSSRPSP